MRQTTNKNLTKQILTLMLAFVMVFTGMGIGSWGVDTAWATDESESTPTSAVWDGTEKTKPQTDENGVPAQKPIVEPWKCPYHNGRMCLELMRRDPDVQV